MIRPSRSPRLVGTYDLLHLSSGKVEQIQHKGRNTLI